MTMDDRPLITCDQLLATLDDYVGETMSGDERREAEKHLSHCRSCVAYTDGYRRTIAMEKSLTKGDLGAELSEDAARRISKRSLG
jgi:hypothetical protein